MIKGVVNLRIPSSGAVGTILNGCGSSIFVFDMYGLYGSML